MAREKNVFKRQKDAYHGLIFSAHLASYYHKSLAELAGSLRKPYIIDPFTFVFARDPGIIRRTERDSKKTILKDKFGKKVKGDVKRSFSRLVNDRYGDVILKTVKAKKRIEPESFKKLADRQNFVESVIDFERTVFAESAAYKKYEKYTKHELASLNREALVAPYFFMEPSRFQDWKSLNLDFVGRTKAMANGEPVYAICSIAKESLGQLASLCAAFKAKGADAVFFWINDFRERDARESDLRLLAEQVDGFADDLECGNLYSGAYSVILGSSNMKMVSCGPCYGDKRSVDQDADDAVIPDRYYFSEFMRKIVLTDFEQSDIDKYPELGCDCDVCDLVEEINKLSEEQCREHFLIRRKHEIETTNTRKMDEWCKMLGKSSDRYKGDAIWKATHIAKWKSALE